MTVLKTILLVLKAILPALNGVLVSLKSVFMGYIWFYSAHETVFAYSSTEYTDWTDEYGFYNLMGGIRILSY